MHRKKNQEQSQRQLKVSKAIHNSLINCFRREGKLDPILYGYPLNITKVHTNLDLRVAHCFFVPFNANITGDKILQALQESKYVIRNYITRQINLKYSPELRFYLDLQFENINTLKQLLKK